MKKLSIRAVEIMVERHKLMAGGNGYQNWYEVMAVEPDYPSVDYVQPCDLAKVLDEYQAQVKERQDKLQATADKALETANEALRLAKLGPDPRLCGGWTDGRS